VLDLDLRRHQAAAAGVVAIGLGLAVSAAQLEGGRQAVTLGLGVLATLVLVPAMFADTKAAAYALTGVSGALVLAAWVNIALPSPDPASAINSHRPVPQATPTAGASQSAFRPPPLLQQQISLGEGGGLEVFAGELLVSTPSVHLLWADVNLSTSRYECSQIIEVGRSIVAPGPTADQWYRLTALNRVVGDRIVIRVQVVSSVTIPPGTFCS
jgi:hypothetical protein